VLTVGDVLTFKHPYQIARYGSTATVLRIHDVFTGSHPGHCFQTLVDLESSNGIQIQWSKSQVSGSFRKTKGA
jgi:hypothetical protein